MAKNENSKATVGKLRKGSKAQEENPAFVGRLSPQATAKLLSAEEQREDKPEPELSEPVEPQPRRSKPFRPDPTRQYLNKAIDAQAAEEKRKGDWDRKNPTAAGISRAQERKAKRQDAEGRKAPVGSGLFAQAMADAGIKLEDFPVAKDSQPEKPRRSKGKGKRRKAHARA